MLLSSETLYILNLTRVSPRISVWEGAFFGVPHGLLYLKENSKWACGGYGISLWNYVKLDTLSVNTANEWDMISGLFDSGLRMENVLPAMHGAIWNRFVNSINRQCRSWRGAAQTQLERPATVLSADWLGMVGCSNGCSSGNTTRWEALLMTSWFNSMK